MIKNEISQKYHINNSPPVKFCNIFLMASGTLAFFSMLVKRERISSRILGCLKIISIIKIK